MADEEINDQTDKAAPDLTDELWLQETGGGATLKALISSLFATLFHARGRVTAGGVLKSGSVGVDNVVRVGTGIFDWTLTNAVTNVNTAVLIPSVVATGAGTEINATMTSTTVCRVETTLGGSAANVQHCLFVFDEA